MRKLISVILASLIGLQAFAQVDSLKAAALSGKLDEYVQAMMTESLPAQCEEVDYIISSIEDKALREIVANDLYKRYYDSKVMGAETVAVHIFDKWFADKSLNMSSDYLTAQVFAEFNRLSLIGKQAPSLELFDREGNRVEVVPGSASRYSVIYFFDADCPKCSVESTILKNVLDEGNYPVDVYLICTTSDKAKWDSYRFNINAARTRVWELHDDDMTFDYQLKYGVIKTPRLYLADENGVVVGRALSANALDMMLAAKFVAPKLDYGEDESKDFYDSVFSQYEKLSVADVIEVADHIEARTIAERKDTTMYRQMMGDLLYYMTTSSEEGIKNAQEQFIEAKILGRPDIWASQDDQMKVVSLAEFMMDLQAKAAVGTMIPDVALRGELKSRFNRNPKVRKHHLRWIFGEENIVLFYVENCAHCAAERAAVDSYILKNKKTRILLVNMTDAIEENPELLDSFDLSASPFLISYNNEGIVTRKYFTIANQ